MAKTIVTAAELQKSAVTYQKQLLQTPVIAAQATLRHMTPVPGVFGRHGIQALQGEFEIAPYKRTRWKDGNVTIKYRELETFLGNMAENFDPNELYGTINGSNVFKGEAVKASRIASDIMFCAMRQIGKKLNMAVFSAERDAEGDTTQTLFDGFDTITSKEIEKGEIAAGNGNYTKLTEAIDNTNAVDIFQTAYESVAPELQGVPVNIYCTYDQKRAYEKDYKATTGGAPYNAQYEQLTLEGSDGLATFVPLVSKAGSKFIHIAPKENMLYGFGNGLAEESVAVEKYKPWEFTLEAALVFGTQFRSIDKEFLHVVELASGV